jgi:hypothetical protein
MAWWRKVGGELARKGVDNALRRLELKLPEKYKGTFIENWGECI